jgi:hypothetical protein
MADTTPSEDVQALRAAIIDVLHTAPYDDMRWPEILAALQLVMHDTRIVFVNYDGFDKAPPPVVEDVSITVPPNA